MIIQEHFYFIRLKQSVNRKDSFVEIEKSFDILASNIEELYWKHYEINQYTVIQSDNWFIEKKKTLLLVISNLFYEIEKISSKLFYLLYVFLVLGISNVITILLDFNFIVLNKLTSLSIILFLTNVIIAIVINLSLKAINKALKKNLIPINGDAFIRNQINIRRG
ncbi:MAG: hypothetical protein KKF57_05040 [Firmicutes bacterium]|nr:hypothetical protein [Bacillota bacterium]